jgi:hypothetical protein
MFNYLKTTQMNLSWLLVIFLIVVGITALPQQVLADEDEDDEDPPKISF